MIKKEKDKYVVKSKDGKRSFGSYNTRKEAAKRLGQVEYFKNKNKYMDGGVTNTAESLSPIMKNSYAGEDEEKLRRYKDGGSKKDRMACNKPGRSEKPDKKFKVKGCQDGKERLIHYGDANMRIKKSNPKNRKSFRARHKCSEAKDKLSARYWSCKKWKDGGLKK